MSYREACILLLGVRKTHPQSDVALHPESDTYYVRIWLGHKIGYVIFDPLTPDELSIALANIKVAQRAIAVTSHADQIGTRQ